MYFCIITVSCNPQEKLCKCKSHFMVISYLTLWNRKVISKKYQPTKNHQQNNNPHLRLNYSIPYWNQWQLKKKNTNTDYFLLILKYFEILGSKVNIVMIFCINLSTK